MRYKIPDYAVSESRQVLGLGIDNDGPNIVYSNYWHSEYESRGLVYLSPNAGVWRLLLPERFDLRSLGDVKGAAITRGRWQGRDAVEVLFDDDSSNPWAFHICTDSVERLPAGDDATPRTITLWKRGPRQVAEYPCFYRLARKLPNLRPWNEGATRQ